MATERGADVPQLGWVAIDFGSTYTKACAIAATGELEDSVYTPTTHQNISTGLDQAVKELRPGFQGPEDTRFLASSSANGGLRVFVVGLVRELSLRAAQMAALGAGAKVVGAVAGIMGSRDVDRCYDSRPDLILLAGGIDGGDTAVITGNAQALASHGDTTVPVIVAGNPTAADDCAAALSNAGMRYHVVGNLLPDIDEIQIDETNAAIRDEFLETITKAKGLTEIQARPDLAGDIMPTPAAVLAGGELLWGATNPATALIVDVGGATTDVYSFCSGRPDDPGVLVKGLPEPYAKRTVEGDLGVRENAAVIAEHVGLDEIARLAQQLLGTLSTRDVVGHLQDIEENGSSFVPVSPEGLAVDATLARIAIRIAVGRHAGDRREVRHGRSTTVIQRGKDLSRVDRVIGIGGVLAHGPHPRFVLRGVTDTPVDDGPTSLIPLHPDFYVDRSYLMFAVGLLGRHDVDGARRLAQQALVMIPEMSE